MTLERENREALWQGLSDGIIDFVVTDHSPCAPGLKDAERGHFHEAWGGIASLQLGLPSLWTQTQARGATLLQMASWTSERAARFAGLGDRKGRITPGYDADCAVWTPEEKLQVAADALFMRHRHYSPYLSATLKGRVARTVLRGVEVFDGKAPSRSPSGRQLLGRDHFARPTESWSRDSLR